MFDRSLLPSPASYYGQFFKFKTRQKALVQCCFHADKTASLSLDLSTGRFYCFGCEAKGGNVLDFHILKHSLDFTEACKGLGAWVDTRQDTPEQLTERKRKIEQADREHKARQEQAAREEQEAAQASIPLVADILRQCIIPMLPPPYAQAKRIGTHNLLSINADRLQRFKNPDGKAMNYGLQGLLTVAVLETLDGQPVALQVFDGVLNDKGKFSRRYVNRPSVVSGYYRLGDFTSPALIVITEGIADAVSCFEATGHPALAAGSVERLEQAAQAVKAKYPAALLVIVGDNDSHGTGQKAARSAAAAVNGRYVIPEGEGIKDANDLLRSNGQEAVKKMIEDILVSEIEAPGQSDETGTGEEAEAQAGEASVAGGGNGGEIPDPLPLTQTLAAVMPFDADLLLPPVLRDFVLDEADRMPCPPDYIANTLLVALGAVIGAGCSIKPKQLDDWLVTANLWGGIVAPPTSKKTPAISAGMKPLDRLITKARYDFVAAKKVYERELMLYEAEMEGLKADLKSAAKNTAKKKPQHTPEELVQLIMAKEEKKPSLACQRRYKTNDCTIEKLGEMEQENPSGLLVLRDELIGLLASLDKEGREGDRAFYLEGWNGTGSYNTDRIMRGSILIDSHCLSVFGGIQPDKLMAYLEQAYSGLGNDGLLQRFQMLIYPDPVAWEYRDRLPNWEAANKVQAIFERLSETDFIEFGASPEDDYNNHPYFRFAPEAQAAFITWTTRLHTQKIASEESSILQQHLGKYDRLFSSLSLIFHLVDCADTGKQSPVSLQAVQYAAAWCDYLETHARRIYGLLLDNGMKSAIALSKRIFQIFQNAQTLTDKTDTTRENWRKKGFVLRDIQRKQWQHLTEKNAIQKALDILENHYWLLSKEQISTENGGRPTTRYFISQKIQNIGALTDKTDTTQKTHYFSDEQEGSVSFVSTILGETKKLKNSDDNFSPDNDNVILANNADFPTDSEVF